MLFNDRFLECIRAAEQQNVLRFSSPQSFSKAIAAVEHGSLEGMMSLQLLFAHAPAALRAEHVRTVFHTADAMAVLHGPQRRCDLVEYCTFFDSSSTGGDSARFLCHLRWTQRNCPRCFLSLSRHCVRTPGSVQTLRDFVCAHEEKAKKLLEKLLPVSESFSRAYAAASATLPSHAEVVEAALAAAAASEQTMPENGAGRDSNRRRRA